MRTTGVLGVAMLVLAAATVHADDLKSGIPVDGRMTKYKAIKCGGGDDGVEFDKSLCYT